MSPEHLDEARIQALLHGELSEQDAASTREHVKGCPACSRQLSEMAEAERIMSGLLSRLDTPPPHVEVGRVMAAASEPPALEVDSRGRRNRWVAAILLVTLIGGAAYAIPGSPLRSWVEGWIPKIFDQNTDPDHAPGPVPPPAPRLGGVAVIPGPRFTIAFTSPSEGTLRVTLVESEHLAVRAPAGTASFESGPDGLVIDARGASTAFEIDIPRSAPHVEIRVEGERVFLKDGTRTEPAPQDTSLLIPLTRARR